MFGLTIGFVAPNVNDLSDVRITLLVAALILLPVAMVASLIRMVQTYGQASDVAALGRAYIKNPNPIPLFASFLAFLIGIGCLAAFASIEVIQVNNHSAHPARATNTTTTTVEHR